MNIDHPFFCICKKIHFFTHSIKWKKKKGKFSYFYLNFFIYIFMQIFIFLFFDWGNRPRHLGVFLTPTECRTDRSRLAYACSLGVFIPLTVRTSWFQFWVTRPALLVRRRVIKSDTYSASNQTMYGKGSYGLYVHKFRGMLKSYVHTIPTHLST